MTNAAKVNRELMRLDSELRAGSIDRGTFRSRRRKLLLDFEERQATTTPGALASSETTLVDPPGEMPLYLPPIAAAPEREEAEPEKRGGKPAAGIAMIAIGAVVLLGLAAWWMFKPESELPVVVAAPATAAPAPAPGAAPIAGADSPQSVASALLATEWTEADIAEFLRSWSTLAPESIVAATEDSRIWLLRGETGRRLRESREAQSIEGSAELHTRVQQLERVQAAIRSP